MCHVPRCATSGARGGVDWDLWSGIRMTTTATFVLSGINHLEGGDSNLSQLPVVLTPSFSACHVTVTLLLSSACHAVFTVFSLSQIICVTPIMSYQKLDSTSNQAL